MNDSTKIKKWNIIFLLLVITSIAFTEQKNITTIFDNAPSYENIPQIPNGEYYVNKIITTFPCETPTEEDTKWIIKVQDEKFFLYYRDETDLGERFSFRKDLEFTEYDNTSENSNKKFNFFSFTPATQKKLPQKGYIIEIGGYDASATSSRQYIIYDGKEIYIVYGESKFAYKYDYIIVYGTENKEPEITYDISFPLYVFNDNGKINAYTTKDFSNSPDLLIPVNRSTERVTKYKSRNGYEVDFYYYYVSDKNIEDLIILNDMVITDSGVFYEGTYHDQTVWINEKDIPKENIFISIDYIHSYVGYINGL